MCRRRSRRRRRENGEEKEEEKECKEGKAAGAVVVIYIKLYGVSNCKIFSYPKLGKSHPSPSMQSVECTE